MYRFIKKKSSPKILLFKKKKKTPPSHTHVILQNQQIIVLPVNVIMSSIPFKRGFRWQNLIMTCGQGKLRLRHKTTMANKNGRTSRSRQQKGHSKGMLEICGLVRLSQIHKIKRSLYTYVLYTFCFVFCFHCFSASFHFACLTLTQK